MLGSAAGGGVPQWNCGCPVCARARAGDPHVSSATQAGLAVSADGETWLLIGASPDLRQQIVDNPALHPRALRHSPIASVLLLSAEVDGIAGLLALRERQEFTLHAPAPILQVLRENPIFGVLDPRLVPRIAVAPMETVEAGAGLALTLLSVPGKTPLYREGQGAAEPEPAPAYAALLRAHGRSVLVVPGCAEITDEVVDLLAQADLVFFDGTLFTDDEMQRAGVGQKTGRRMGHVPMAGPGGSLHRLGGLPSRRIYLHINNTNPVLCAASPERAAVAAAGFEIAHDGMEIRL